MISSFDFWQFFGGLGLFLYTMYQIEQSLTVLGSKTLRNFLVQHTDRPYKSILSGAFTTAMLQSSSLVGLLVLAFTGAGLISLNNALGVIIGSNLGTTLTGWVVATVGFKLDLDAFSFPLIAIGSLISFTLKGNKRQIGMVLTAIGLLLLGLDFMQSSVSGLKEQFEISNLKNFSAWQYLAFGTLFAAIVQSSSATIIIALAALDGGIISLPSAAAIAIGADLGTTSTLIIGASNGVPNKKRVAAAHVIFNFVTDITAFVLLTYLLQFVKLIGISSPLYSLVAFHTLFNLLGIVIFFPFIHILARFLEKTFQEKKVVIARYINQITTDISSAALIAIHNEASHLLQRVFYQNRYGFKTKITEPAGFIPLNQSMQLNIEKPVSFNRLYHDTKVLEGEILLFATDLQAQSLEPQESLHLTVLLDIIRNAIHASKSIKDIEQDLAIFELSRKPAIKEFVEKLHDIMNDFYCAVFSLKSLETDQVLEEELATLKSHIENWHDTLHKLIINKVHMRQIAETEASSMLNVNREIFNSNLSLMSALCDYHATTK